MFFSFLLLSFTKQKKGGLARDEEDIEYIGLSSSNNSSSILPRVTFKRTKIDVEENEDADGSTPKLTFPKYRLRDRYTTNTITTLTTDLSDLHVYVFSPWVVQNLIQMRSGINSIQEELIPLLISRQFRGIEAAFGKKCLMNPENEALVHSIISSRSTYLHTNPWNSNEEESTSQNEDLRVQTHKSKNVARPFFCAAFVLPRDINSIHPRPLTLRACAIPSYLYTCREMVMNAISRSNSSSFSSPSHSNTKHSSTKGNSSHTKAHSTNNKQNENPALSLPEGCQIQAKYNSLILPHTTVGEKLRLQNSTIGSHCTIGPKCKLNNVVIMDNVTIGENCTLQNSVIGMGVVLGENCSLNDSQIGHGFVLAKGTKVKGESLTKN